MEGRVLRRPNAAAALDSLRSRQGRDQASARGVRDPHRTVFRVGPSLLPLRTGRAIPTRDRRGRASRGHGRAHVMLVRGPGPGLPLCRGRGVGVRRALHIRRDGVLRHRLREGNASPHGPLHPRGAGRAKGHHAIWRDSPAGRAGVDRRRRPAASRRGGLAPGLRAPRRTGANSRVVAGSYLRPSLVKWTVDTEAGLISKEEDGPAAQKIPLYSTAGFEELSKLWLKVGWNQKYAYTFTWLGRPVIQLPDDMIRVQEVLHHVRPDVIVECGVAHGGSLVYYASICKLAGRGRIVGIDIEIRPHNRAAIEAHPLSPLITLIEGSSTAPETVAAAAAEIRAGETVLVILDSNHTRKHVRAELESYAPFVSVDSYLVVMDGIMRLVADTPRGDLDWEADNPIAAVEDFVADNADFVVEQPPWPFNESELRSNVTYYPRGFLRRVR